MICIEYAVVIWLINSFIPQPTLSCWIVLLCYKFLVCQIPSCHTSILSECLSPLENYILLPKKSVTLSLPFREPILPVGTWKWAVQAVHSSQKWQLWLPLAQVVRCLLYLFYFQCFHLSRCTGAFCAWVQCVSLYSLAWTQREVIKTHFV